MNADPMSTMNRQSGSLGVDGICHFVFASDDNFTVQLQAAVLSLLKVSVAVHSAQHVHVLDCGISDEKWRSVETRILLFARRCSVPCKISRHHIDMHRFEQFRIWNSSKATYARLLLPSLLPEVQYCVYSDCDMLFFENPWILVDVLRHENVAVLGHQNPIDRDGKTMDERWFIKNNVPYNHASYFCAGLIALDLDKFRKSGAVESMFDFLGRYHDVVSADQTALNWYFRNESALAPDGWGVFPRECFGDINEIFAIHYSGGSPWKDVVSWYAYLMMKPVDDIWLSFVRSTLGGNACRRRVLPSARFLGSLAMAIVRLIFLLKINLPFRREFMRESYDVLHRHSALDNARKRLLDGL